MDTYFNVTVVGDFQLKSDVQHHDLCISDYWSLSPWTEPLFKRTVQVSLTLQMVPCDAFPGESKRQKGSDFYRLEWMMSFLYRLLLVANGRLLPTSQNRVQTPSERVWLDMKGFWKSELQRKRRVNTAHAFDFTRCSSSACKDKDCTRLFEQSTDDKCRTPEGRHR